MNKARVSYLCQGYLNNTATPLELIELETVLIDPFWEEELRRILTESYLTLKIEVSAGTGNSVVKERIFRTVISNPQDIPKVRIWPRILAVAAVLLVILGLSLFYKLHNLKQHTESSLSQGQVLPGKNGATLTLSNGRKILLNDVANGELANEDGVTVSKNADGSLVYSGRDSDGENAINTVSTNRGETYQITLPDGSKVWLNAASSLAYTATLNENGNRKVKLQGEAYFEVVKDANHPFIVVSEDQQIKVLGTHFNVSSYPDDKVSLTTLLEGSVDINGTLLKPGHQAIQKNHQISVKQVDTRAAVGWKNGVFIYSNENLEGIMKELSRWYDVEVIYADPALKQKTFSGSLSRYANVEDFIKVLKFAGINCKLDQRTIYITN